MPPVYRISGPRPVAASFVTFGIFWGTWAILIAEVQKTFGLSDGRLGLLLAVALALAGVNGAVMGHHAERFGSGPLLWISLVVWAVCMATIGIARGPWSFAVLFCVAEIAAGCVDTGMNVAASRRFAGRSGDLLRFHALFNVGAVSGAVISGAAIGLGLSWRLVWPTLALWVVLLALWTRHSQYDEPNHAVQATVPTKGRKPARLLGPIRQLRSDGLLVFLCIFAAAEIVEGGVDTWGVLYLRTHLRSGILIGAGAYVIGHTVASATRGVGGPTLGRLLPPRLALMTGGLVAGGGILLESMTPIAVIAAIGLAAGAAGAALFWPLVMSQVTTQSSRPTSAVGAFTAAGYVGWVAGAPAVGWVSDTWGPPRGLLLLAALAGTVVIGSTVAHRHEKRGPKVGMRGE